MRTELVHEPLRCIGCNTCVENCPQGALQKGERGLIFDDSCRRCLRCADNCPARAIRVFGVQVRPDELVDKLIRDKPFYDRSGGGVTFSGGECLLQYRFLLETIPLLKSKGIHICIDTAGCVSPDIFQAVAREADLVLYDLKMIDDEKHRLYTGGSNAQILENAAWLGASGIPFWIRVPVIPGCTAGEEDISATARFIQEHMRPPERVDLLGYNDLCAGDYKRLGLDYSLRGVPRLNESAMMRLKEIMLTSGARLVTISNYT